MAETKTVSAPLMVAAWAFGTLVGAGGAKLYIENPDGTISQVQVGAIEKTNELLDNATEECRAEVEQAGDEVGCEIGMTRFAKDIPPPTIDEETGEKVPPDMSKVAQHEGWICNGAFMPQRIQTCLDAALEKMSAPIKEVVPK